MQKVAWPTITVNRRQVRRSSTCVKVAFSAMPVTIPGSASGRITRNEIVSRPKKRCARPAIAASVPSTSAIAVAPSPALTRRQQRVAHARVVERLAEPLERQPVDRPRLERDSLNA